MNIKVHYLVTLCALFFLGVIVTKPGQLIPNEKSERTCKLMKGKMDCFYKYSEYRINANYEVQYKLN